MNVKDIIFDLDGTLLHSAPGILSSLHTAMSAAYPQGIDSLEKIIIGPPIAIMLNAALPDISESTISEISAAYRVSYDEYGWQDSTLYPSALETLSWLKEAGIGIYLATNKPSVVTEKIISHFGLTDFFADVKCVCIDDEECSTKSKMVNTILKKNNINVLNSILVGDTKSDGGAAFDNSLRFMWASYGYGSLQDMRDTPIHLPLNRLEDIKSFVEE